MIFRKRKKEKRTYDSGKMEPVLRCSICTGETEAGFMDRESGKFTGLLLIRKPSDLEDFKEEWGVTEMRKIY